MTKKHFQAIADAVNSQVRVTIAEPTLQDIRRQTLRDVAYQLADMLAAENPRFQFDRFLTACGVKGGR